MDLYFNIKSIHFNLYIYEVVDCHTRLSHICFQWVRHYFAMQLDWGMKQEVFVMLCHFELFQQLSSI